MDTFLEVLSVTLQERVKEQPDKPTFIRMDDVKMDEDDLKQKLETILNGERSVAIPIDSQSHTEQGKPFLIRNKGWMFISLFLVILVLSLFLISFGQWKTGLSLLVFSVLLLIIIAIRSRLESGRKIAYAYTFKLIALFYLCETPQTGGTVSKNRFVIISQKESYADSCVNSICNMLKIPSIEDLSSVWKIAVETEHNIDKYSWWANSTKFLNQVPNWVVLAIIAIFLCVIFIVFCIHESYLAASGVIGTPLFSVATLLYRCLKPRSDDKPLTAEEKTRAVDLICRFHELSTKEKITFVFIAEGEISSPLAQYFSTECPMKPSVVINVKKPLIPGQEPPTLPSNYHHRDFHFNLGCLEEPPENERESPETRNKVKQRLRADVKKLEEGEDTAQEIFSLNGVKFVLQHFDALQQCMKVVEIHFKVLRSIYPEEAEEEKEKSDDDGNDSALPSNPTDTGIIMRSDNPEPPFTARRTGVHRYNLRHRMQGGETRAFRDVLEAMVRARKPVERESSEQES